MPEIAGRGKPIEFKSIAARQFVSSWPGTKFPEG
jgi:hypothetical protein